MENVFQPAIILKSPKIRYRHVTDKPVAYTVPVLVESNLPFALLKIAPRQQFRELIKALLGKPRPLFVVARLGLKVLRETDGELTQFGKAAFARALSPHVLELRVDDVRGGLGVMVLTQVLKL